ncbi:hypothetical protein F511_08565 [Dorcoceras hygrometricum]|uniref:Uncharacterized protein n=1 Tax=Dorcoceras hygrometricum TaxID=472368 RepID=A0A2Z7D098_9LAMI|nr:hypothetical protein F511_08565 [Dorcoceras hygrometricum]
MQNLNLARILMRDPNQKASGSMKNFIKEIITMLELRKAAVGGEVVDDCMKKKMVRRRRLLYDSSGEGPICREPNVDQG